MSNETRLLTTYFSCVAVQHQLRIGSMTLFSSVGLSQELCVTWTMFTFFGDTDQELTSRLITGQRRKNANETFYCMLASATFLKIARNFGPL